MMPIQKKKTGARVKAEARRSGSAQGMKAVSPGWLDGGLPEFIWLVIIFLLPLFFWPGAYTSFELPKVTLFRTMTFVLLVSFLIRIARKRAADVSVAQKEGSVSMPDITRLKWPLILLGLTVISWVVSTILSPAPAVSFFGYYPRFQGLYTWTTYLVFGAVVFLGINKRVQIERIFSAIAASSLLVAVLAFLQSRGAAWLNHWDVSAFLGRFFGTMGHPDYLASWLVVTIPLSAAMLCVKKTRILGGAALVLSLCALYFTFSRSAWLGLFAALFVFLIAAARKMKWKKMFWAALIVPVLLTACVILVNLNGQSDAVKNNPLFARVVLQGENLRSVQTRLVLWPATVSQILHSPLAGYGLDTYAITFPAFAPAELNTLENMGDYPDRAHNLVLDYAVQFGIPGLLIFAGFLLSVFACGFRFVFARKKDWLVPLALLASLTGILVTNLFGFFITVTWVYFWLLIAVLFNQVIPKAGNSAADAESKPFAGFLTRKWAGKIFISIVVCAGVGVIITQDFMLFAADINYRTGALNGDAQAMSAASSLAPQISFYPLQQANFLLGASPDGDLYLSALKALEQAGRVTARDGFYYLYKGIITSAITCSPLDTQCTAICPKCPAFNESSSNGGAGQFFTLAAAKMPAYPTVPLEFGKALLKEGRYARAAAEFEKYLAISPPYYLWKNSLGSHTAEEQERYRIFYKLNPDFDSVFRLLTEASIKAGDLHKAALYGGYLYY